MSTTTPVRGRDTQQDSDGDTSYNPSHQNYEKQFSFDDIVNNGLKDVEARGTDIINDDASSSESVRQREQAPRISTPLPQVQPKQKSAPNRVQQIISKFKPSKKLKGKSSLAALLLLLFGGGTALTVFFSPGLVIIGFKEVMTQNLNEQLHTVSERETLLMRAKMKDLTNGSCGTVKIQCRFSTISDEQVKKFKAAGIEIKTTPKAERKFFNGKRGQILEINYIDKEGVTVIKSAEELQRNLLNNVPFRSAMIKGFNPSMMSINDRLGLGYLKKIGASKGLVITGETDEDKQRNLDKTVAKGAKLDTKSIVTKTDKDGKETYYDSDGNELTKEQVDAATEQSKRFAEDSKNGGTSAVLKNAVKGANIVGYMDSACTVYNTFRLVSGLAKVEREAQLARLAMSLVLTPADASKAGDITPDSLEFAGKVLNTPYESDTAINQSSLYSNALTTQKDPEKGMTATDGPGYRMMAYGEAPDLSMRASQFMVGGGSVALLDGVLRGVATVVNGGDPNPQQVSQKCGWIQNPVVRITGLTIGIVAGVGTFGLSTAIGIGGSTVVSLALPYLESQVAGLLAGDGVNNLSSVNAGDGVVVGAGGLFGGIARTRGLKPLSASEGMKYAVASQTTKSQYVESQQYLARATPFDINNPYSFLGSIGMTISPLLQRSKTSASMALMNVTSLIPTSFASLTKTAGAASRTLDPDYYNKCNDEGYKQLGLGANAFCVVSYGISEDELKILPGTVIGYMVGNGEIDTESENGDAKDNGKDWNYVKWMKECPNRTVGWGENQDENQGNGWNCVDPAKEPQNKFYRLFHIDKSVDAALDGEPIAASGSAAAATQSDVTGSGWTFPTATTARITSGYKTNERPDHNGVDLAFGSASETLGQPIYAARDGVVTAAGKADGYGNWIVIKHEIGGKTYSTVYGHMFDDGVLVKAGDQVKAGAVIGKIGNNGQSTGPHLHFEIWDGDPVGWWKGQQIDPTPIIEQSRRPAGDGAINV